MFYSCLLPFLRGGLGCCYLRARLLVLLLALIGVTLGLPKKFDMYNAHFGFAAIASTLKKLRLSCTFWPAGLITVPLSSFTSLAVNSSAYLRASIKQSLAVNLPVLLYLPSSELRRITDIGPYFSYSLRP